MPRLNQITITWTAVFALVHVYWAAGGEAGMNGDPADTVGAQAYIAFIALLGLAGVVFGTVRRLAEGGLDGDGAAGVVTTLYFLAGGLLCSALARRGFNRPMPEMAETPAAIRRARPCRPGAPRRGVHPRCRAAAERLTGPGRRPLRLVFRSR